MNMMSYRKEKFIISLIILFALILISFLPKSYKNNESIEYSYNFSSFNEIEIQGDLQASSEELLEKQWLKNSNFSSSEYWNLIKGDLGDKSDVTGNINQGQANIKVLGDSGELIIDEPLNDTDWTLTKNPDLPILPDRREINSSGCHISHVWDEDVNQTRNRPSVHWKRTINLPVDMSDYIITSASLNVMFNATVTVSPHDGGGIDREGDAGVIYYSTGDFAKFYVSLSDVQGNIQPIQVAYNNTGDLGRDTPRISNYSDTPMNHIPESVLISVLTSVLENDGYNFTIILGIDIYCEDNEWSDDLDIWDSLIIRSFNLSFTYEKKINQFTSASWNQEGNIITGNNVQVTDANLKFKYKINQAWPELSSPNSEIRILINDNQFTRTIKLSSAKTFFQEAQEDGYDVTALITKDVNVSLSIQVFLADEFSLDRNITISIDDVFLEISLIFIYPEEVFEPWIFTTLLIVASIVTVGLSGYLIAYQRVLKYPVPVRKVRKYRRSLKAQKEPKVLIIPRERAFERAYDREVSESSKLLNAKLLLVKGKPIKMKEPLKPSKPTSTLLEQKINSEKLIAKSLEKKAELDKLVKDLPKE